METRALLRLGVVNRLLRRGGDPLVSRRAGEFLDHVSEVVFVDVVYRWLVLVEIAVINLMLRLLLRRRRRRKLVISFLIHGGGDGRGGG